MPGIAQGSIIQHYDNLSFHISSMFSTQKYTDAPFLIIHGKLRPVQHITWCTQFPSAHLWHNKLVHPSLGLVFYILLCLMLYLQINHCYVCPLATQMQLLFHLSLIVSYISIVSSQLFHMFVHCDIWGPFPTVTINGLQYFFDHCK